MQTVQKMWVGFKKLFRTMHRELRETIDLTVQDAGMHHANMVRDVVAGLQEVLQKEPVPVEALVAMQELQMVHVANVIQYNQLQLSSWIQ